MALNKLTLFSKIIPALKRWSDDNKNETVIEAHQRDGDLRIFESRITANIILYRFEQNNTIIFDCTNLPIDFVDDAGQAALAELVQMPKKVRLPFPCCYFELTGGVPLFASETWISEKEQEERSVSEDADAGPFVELVSPLMDAPEREFANSLERRSFFPNGYRMHAHDPEQDLLTGDDVPFIRYHNVEGMSDQMAVNRMTAILLGVLTLLEEKLLTQEVMPDPAPRLTAARLKRGQHPLTAETRVLRINVPAVRRIVARVNVLKHESPRLHWRRGHWRVLHRGSEFEGRAWVRKCLVGDPDKGFVRKEYRLMMQQPMIVPSELSEPTIVG